MNTRLKEVPYWHLEKRDIGVLLVMAYAVYELYIVKYSNIQVSSIHYALLH